MRVGRVCRSVLGGLFRSDGGFRGQGANAASPGCEKRNRWVCLGVPVVHPRFARIHVAACVAFFLSFDFVSSPWMELGVGGLLLNFIACLFSVGFCLFFTEVRI